MSFDDDLRTDPKALAKKYSFYPENPAYPEWTFSDTQVTKKALSGQFEGFNRIHVKKDFLIAKVHPELKMTDRGQSLVVKPSFDEHAQGVSVYFLPWTDKGAAVRMKIPDLDPNKPEHEHPKVFFTAVLSGCTIVFKGTVQNPTIYHCGTGGGHGDTQIGTPTKGNSNIFFSNMLSGPGYRPFVSRIQSTDYMIPNKLDAPGVEDLQRRFLESILAQRQRGKGFIIKDVKVWGACFGIRSGRDWKFYLQKNGTISYTRVEEVTQDKDIQKKGFFGSKTIKTQFVTTKVTTGNRVCRPVEVQRVFPGGGTAKVTPSWSVLEL